MRCWADGSGAGAHPKAGREPRRQDERTRFHRLVDRTWEGLANRGVTVHYLSRTHISCRCPICVRGIVSIHFIESDPPQIDIDHDGCTAGCTAREIMELVG